MEQNCGETEDSGDLKVSRKWKEACRHFGDGVQISAGYVCVLFEILEFIFKGRGQTKQ